MVLLDRLSWWSFAIAIWLPSVLSFPSGDGWEWMSGAADLDGALFMDFAYPIAEMSANAYRYPNHLHPISGWSVSSLIAPLHSSYGGAHALVFEENPMDSPQYTHNSPCPDQHEANPHFAHMDPAYTESCSHHARRVIIAFRGTQISPSIDSLADVCADKLLWEGFDLSSLPVECLVFDLNTLDYFSQALNYTQQVISHYASMPILLTGHSLGAGLAILVAAALSYTHTLAVIGFGAPGTRKALFDRGLSIRPLKNNSIMVIGHEWDVIMRTQMEGQVGSLCFYPQTESTACKACISSLSLQPEGFGAFSVYNIEDEVMPNMKESASESINAWRRSALERSAKLPEGDCMECFLETHYLKSLIAVVKQGEKPTCQHALGLRSSIKPQVLGGLLQSDCTE